MVQSETVNLWWLVSALSLVLSIQRVGVFCAHAKSRVDYGVVELMLKEGILDLGSVMISRSRNWRFAKEDAS